MRFAEPTIIDLVTSVESEVFQTDAGPMVWGAVEITYSCDGIEPRVSLRVPIPAIVSESNEIRRSEALRRARKLIDHACIAMEPPSAPSLAIGEMLVGLSEELGLFSPTTRPRPSRRQ